MCAETYNETARGIETDDGAGSAEMYAQSLVPDIAEVADVNETQLINDSARENPDDGSLMIQFGVVDGRQTNAAEAVDNLHRRLLPGSGRRRRAADTEAWLLTSTLDNKTVTPTDIYNWTDDGPCPTQRCGQGRRCSWRPDVQFYCTCSYGVDGDCSPVAVPSTTGTCVSRADCIIPVIIIAVAGVLLFVVVIVVVVRSYRRRQRYRDKSLKMVFSRSDGANPVLDLQVIDAQSVTASQTVSSVAQPRPPPPSVIDDTARKPRNWTRLRFKRTRRHLDPVATDEKGYPSAVRSVINIDDAESTLSDNSGLPIHHSTTTIANNELLSY